jgi:hypothetical protein
MREAEALEHHHVFAKGAGTFGPTIRGGVEGGGSTAPSRPVEWQTAQETDIVATFPAPKLHPLRRTLL